MSRELTLGLGITGLAITATPYLAGVAQAGIACAEIGTTGIYQGNMTGAAGTYTLDFTDAGSAHRGTGLITWDGTKELGSPANIAGLNSVKLQGNGTSQPFFT